MTPRHDATNDDPLLSVRDLRVRFETDGDSVRAVRGIDFDVERGETVCIVGESGSGKTVTIESITGLLRSPPASIEGEIRFDGHDLTGMSAARLRRVRGERIAHVFQDSAGSFNPVYTVGAHLREAIGAHRDVTRREGRERAIELLEGVGVPAPASRVDAYPHELSGGLRQRVAIAIALACEPDLLLADEPTTALDVTVEAAVLDLLAELQSIHGMSICYVTHDLGVVAQLADRVIVLYDGCVVERATVYDLFERPAHPYTRKLLSSLPGRDGDRTQRWDDSATPGDEPVDASTPPRHGSDGIVNSPSDRAPPASGCRYAGRCPHARPDCREWEQTLLPVPNSGDGHVAACLLYGDEFEASSLERSSESGSASSKPPADSSSSTGSGDSGGETR